MYLPECVECWNAFISREKAHDLFSRLSFCSSSLLSFDHIVSSFSFRLVSLCLLPSSSPLIFMPFYHIFLAYSVPFHRLLSLPNFSCIFKSHSLPYTFLFLPHPSTIRPFLSPVHPSIPFPELLLFHKPFSLPSPSPAPHLAPPRPTLLSPGAGH